MRTIRAILTACLAACLGTAAMGQSLNIEFGSELSKPAMSYGATGARGYWNTFSNMPSNQRFSLRGLNAQPLASARVYNIGTTQMLTHDHPATTGDDDELLDEMYLSFNNPIDACIFFEGMRNGRYEVLLYAWTPNNANLRCRTRVDNSPEPPAMVGGAWTGAHAPGVTYARFTVRATNGTLGMHSGLFGGNIQSGLNGLQLRFLDGCRADLDNGSGLGIPDDAVTIDDLLYFLDYFAQGTLEADLDDGTGAGVPDRAVTIDDLLFFLERYSRGC